MLWNSEDTILEKASSDDWKTESARYIYIYNIYIYIYIYCFDIFDDCVIFIDVHCCRGSKM